MKRLTAALLTSAALTGPALSFDIQSMTDDEKAAFGVAVREYLMANPEVLVESINVLEERRAQQAVSDDKALLAANHDAIFDDGHSWVGGNPDGDVTVVEFMDYRCGYCRQFNPQVRELVESDGNIRLIVKEFPILGDDSEASARFAVAVKQIAGDDAYAAAHHALIGLRAAPTPEALTRIAADIGVDADEVLNLMQTEDVTAILRDNRELAQTMGIQGTPSFVIGDQLLRGMPAGGLAATVAAAREAAKG